MSDFNVGGFIGDVLTTGGNIYSGILKRDIEREDTLQAQEAARIAALQADAERQRAEAKVSTIKAYILPIAIIGVVVVGGIATYMYYKNK